tara:strand:+ start:93 stop:881 length:789 start_codon:yes stop_codon:yes gene_type:complete
MSKSNVIIDLDNTIISCITNNQKNSSIISSLTSKYTSYHKLVEHNTTKYIIFERNNLKSFLDYIFENFNVSIWTAATRRYSSFVIQNVFKGRNIDYIFFDYHVDLSKKLYDQNPKHLNLLFDTFQLPNYNINNTILVDNLQSIANPTLPYKTYCCNSFNMIDCINTYNNDNELQKIITYLKDTFNIPTTPIPTTSVPTTSTPTTPTPSVPKYEKLGWKKVESRSRPGQYSYENIHTGERISDEPKYEASKIENQSKDLLEYE